MGTYKCKGLPGEGLICIRGQLFKEDILNGARTQVRPCPVCAGEIETPPQKVVQMPGVVDKKAEVPVGVRQVYTNVMGHTREPLNAKHEELVRRVRDIGLEFYVLLHDAGGTDPNEERFANRNLAIASSNVEDAVMHAVKGICKRK